MNGCYIGRGSLLVSPLGAGRGFFTLSGESELKVDFEEDNESVLDARHGVNERVDWYVRNRRMRVEAECFRIEPAAMELLLKAEHTAPVASSGNMPLPFAFVGLGYGLKPNLTPGTVVVTDLLATVIPNTKYVVDLDYGLITFSDVLGYSQPFNVFAAWGTHDALAIHTKLQVTCEARFHGFNKVTGKKVMAEFYRLALDISEELKLVQKGFSPMSVRLQATPDTSQPLDPQLGQYGRIILL